MMSLIGNTPLIKIDTVNGNEIFAKLEYYNPTGSVKDRAAYYMIMKALERGDIDKSSTIIEPTSGNTGIGIAFVCSRLGMKTILTMPESMSLERRQILSALGAEIVLTPASEGMQGSVDKARQLVQEIDNSYSPDQFANPDNALAHFEGTAPEVYNQINADYIIDGVGSGGTLMGFKDYIIANNKSGLTVAVEPSTNTILSNGVIGAHKIQGIGANFIPKLVDVSKIDKYISITSDEAFEGARLLSREFGVMSGISGGANYIASVKLAKEVSDKKIVIIIPDNAMKYLSMNIYG